MKKRSRILSFMLVCMLCIATVAIPVKADEETELSDAKDKKEELEEEQKRLEEKQNQLEKDLKAIVAEAEEAQEKLEAKQLELAETQDELDFAKIEERNQYNDMKLRIKFMYENGDTEMLEMLFESETIAEFLNKAEYIQQVSEYDRNQLNAFQATVKQIEETEAKLMKEEEELIALQDELTTKQDKIEKLLRDANSELKDVSEELGKTAKTIETLIAKIKEKQQLQNSAGGGTAGPSQVIGNGTLAWPTTSTRVTSYYGWRVAPVAGATSWHDAIDIGAPTGTPVYASADGTVITAKWGYNGGRGVYVMIDHHNGIVTRYQHLSDMYVSVGQKVTKGQNIAAVGNTGASSGPHLDYAIYVNGKAVDPLTYY